MGGYTPPPPPPPPASYIPPPPPPPAYGIQQEKTSPGAIWALVLGIASWVLCGILASVPAWIVGKIELNKINAGYSSQSGKSLATIGMWLGIVQVIISIIAVIGFFILMSLGFLKGFLENY